MQIDVRGLGLRSLMGSILCVSVCAVAADLPAPALSQPVTDVLHGVSVPDPYRNLEDVKSPATKAWLSAQGAYAAQVLARIEGRDQLAERIQALAKTSGDRVRSVVRMPGNRVYFLKRKAGEGQFKLWLRDAVSGAERVLVDPDQLSKSTGVPHAINYFVPSWDGKLLAYGVSAGGSENASLYLLDIAAGKLIGQPIPRVPDGERVHWTPDSRSLSYNQLRALPADAPDTETYLDTTVYVLKAGDASATPQPIFGPLVNPELKLDRLDVAAVFFAPGSPYMIARTTDTTVPEGRIYVAPLAQLGQKKAAWRQISGFDDKITAVALRGDTLYFRTYAGAPRGRVLALGLKDPVLSKARLVVPEPAVGVLDKFGLGPRDVYAEVRKGFDTRVLRYALAKVGQGADVAPKLAGSTSLVDDPAQSEPIPWVETSTWTDPPVLLAVANDGSTRDTGIMNNRRPPDSPDIEVSEVLVTSHDGAKVPLAILRRKGLAQDGNNPTLLDGYGAYGFSYESFYDPRRLAWLERGGVLAYANVRGSGAFGNDWYRAGFKTTKSNTWNDGIAAARYLIDQKYTSPKRLAVEGTSAGGIFVGRAVTSAPDLFAAAIFNVGVMDAVRAEESANGITNISEFGSAKNPAEFPALLEMSTYHQIKDGTAYPGVLLIHGLNDPRVDVWHSAKAAARLQAASSSGKPVLLRLDGQAGHGMGSTAQQRASELADTYSFLLWQFGLTTLKP